jgi:hypothetical protein
MHLSESLAVGELQKKLEQITEVDRVVNMDGKPVPDLTVSDTTEKLSGRTLKSFFDHDTGLAEEATPC